MVGGADRHARPQLLEEAQDGHIAELDRRARWHQRTYIPSRMGVTISFRALRPAVRCPYATIATAKRGTRQQRKRASTSSAQERVRTLVQKLGGKR